MKIQIGKYKLGAAPLSMIALFIALSVCAIASALSLSCPECSMPLSYAVIINEGMALLATLVYGIFAHFALTIINRIRKK